MFRFHILGLIRSRHSSHGYALMKEYNRRTGRTHGAGYFYRQLSELLSEGYIRSTPNPMGADPRRTPYAITKEGERAFDEWFEDVRPISLETDVDRVGRAMFFSDVAPDTGTRVLDLWQSHLLERAKILERELLEARAARKTETDMKPMLLRRELLRIAADLEFIGEVGQTIKERPDGDRAWAQAAAAQPPPQRHSSDAARAPAEDKSLRRYRSVGN